jgi:hypothetical protein
MYFIKKQKYFNDHVAFSSPGRSASEKKFGRNHTRYNVTINSSMASSICNTNSFKKIWSIKIVIINVMAWFIYNLKMITGNIFIPFIIILISSVDAGYEF